jgi:glycosyltransferase involved in cell wall biosynthesis
MNILMVVESFTPSKGYLEFYLSRELIKKGNKVVVVSYAPNRKVVTINKNFFKLILLTSLFDIHSYHFPGIKTIMYLLKIIREEKPQILHCLPLFSPTCIFLIFQKRLFKYKCVGSIISGEFLLNSIINQLLFKLLKWGIFLIKHSIDQVYAINPVSKDYISKTFNIPSEKITVIPLGVDTNLFKFENDKRIYIRAKLGIDVDDILICYSGRIMPEKQLEILIMAVAPIITHNQRVKLLIIGEGDPKYLEILKRLISEKNIQNNVIFHPAVHRSELPAYYSACDLAIWPAAPSISILEAASVGLPVISGSIFYYKDLADAKLIDLVERGDWVSLSRLIHYYVMMSSDLREKIRNDKRKKVLKELDWKVIAEKYINSYRSLLVSNNYI